MEQLKWTSLDIPDQSGKIILITGATSGLGKEATKVLAQKGATIIMAARNTEKAKTVCEDIRKIYPNAKLDISFIDLSSLKSIKLFSDEILAKYDRLDILINNAGIMFCPFSTTQDGFEIQMGTNHLGPFALTAQLMPLLAKTPNSRIVNTSSMAHKNGSINFDDFNWTDRPYKTMQAYSDSKLANLYFTYELANKLKNQKNAPMVVCAHPGWTKTDLDRHSSFAAFFGLTIAQKVEMGTLPTLRAASDPKANSGDYFGPSGFLEIRGNPIKVKSSARSHDETLAKKLWNLSEELTGIKF